MKGQVVSGSDFPILDLKSWSRGQAMKLDVELGRVLTSLQISEIYSSNFHAILKINQITHGNITWDVWEKNKKQFDQIINEREVTYKKVLTPDQFKKYSEVEKKSSTSLVNTKIQVSNQNNSNDSITSVTYPTN